MILGNINHSKRVASLSYRLSERLNLPTAMIEDIYYSALLHDVGKSNLNQNILNKPDKLNEKEKKHIEMHSYFSYVEALKVGFSRDMALNILHHHENFNGTGYPERLKKDNIPLGARIIRICDVYDALTSNRVYRKALSVNEAIDIMNNEKENFDPNIYSRFKNMIDISFMDKQTTKGFELKGELNI